MVKKGVKKNVKKNVKKVEKKKLAKEQKKKVKKVKKQKGGKLKNKFSQVSLSERESDIGDIEDVVEVVEKKDNINEFADFVSEDRGSGGEIVEIAPGASHELVSGEAPITDLEQEFAPVAGADDEGKKEDSAIKYGVAEQVYKQAGEMRAYEEAREQERAEGRAVVRNRGLQSGSDIERIKDVSLRMNTNVRPIDIPEMWGVRNSGGEEVARGNYLSSADIEKETDISKIEKRKYEIGG